MNNSCFYRMRFVRSLIGKNSSITSSLRVDQNMKPILGWCVPLILSLFFVSSPFSVQFSGLVGVCVNWNDTRCVWLPAPAKSEWASVPRWDSAASADRVWCLVARWCRSSSSSSSSSSSEIISLFVSSFLSHRVVYVRVGFSADGISVYANRLLISEAVGACTLLRSVFNFSSFSTF